jgi:hypothetical protein
VFVTTMPGLTREENRFRDGNPVKGLKRDRRTWDEIYEALIAYKGQHGDCDVPMRYKEDLGLGTWVKKQKKDKEILSAEQRKRLDHLGFDWATRQEREDIYWNEKFKRLKEYRQIYGDCKVPRNSSVNEELIPWVKEIGIWVFTQRRNCKKGKLSSDRISKLKSLQFEWVLREPVMNKNTSAADEKWYQQYLKLLEFHKERGHCIVRRSYDGPQSLSLWVGKQRQYYGENGLAEDRKHLLEVLGFIWKFDGPGPADTSLSQIEWDNQLNRIIQHKEQYGHCDFSRKSTKWGLGSWLIKQRAEAYKGQLDTCRVRKLLSIGVPPNNSRRR